MKSYLDDWEQNVKIGNAQKQKKRELRSPPRNCSDPILSFVYINSIFELPIEAFADDNAILFKDSNRPI